MAIHVVKLGGSMISRSPDVMFDFDYMKSFSKVLKKFIDKGDKFFVVLGGGFMMRKYRDMAKEAGIIKDHDLHWIGTTYNVLNAHIARASMSDFSEEKVFAFEDYYDNKPIEFSKSVIFGGGGRPGHSGDMDILLIAKRLGVKNIISLKNIDGVYSADPKKVPDALRIDKLTWQKYFEIIGFKDEHEPGGNYPIDPVTSKEAENYGAKYMIIEGNDLVSFEKAIGNEEFKGSIVGI